METVPWESVQNEYHQPLLVPVWFVVTAAVAVVAVRSSAVTAASAMVQTLLTLSSRRPRLRPLGWVDTFMWCASCDGSAGGSMPDSVGLCASTVNCFGECFEIFARSREEEDSHFSSS